MSLITKIREGLGNFGANVRSRMEAPRMENYQTQDKQLNYLRYKAQLLKEKQEKQKLKNILKKVEIQKDRQYNFKNQISNPKQNINIVKQQNLFKVKAIDDHNNIFRRR